MRGMLTATALFFAGVLWPAHAHADEIDYLSGLDSVGVYYDSSVDAINDGKYVCKMLRSGVPVKSIMTDLASKGYAWGETGIVVGAASVYMCTEYEDSTKRQVADLKAQGLY